MHSTITEINQESSFLAVDAIEIIFKLKKMGLTQSKIARTLGVNPSIISNVIHSRATCFPVATHIAELLGADIHMLWPNRYVFKPRPNHKQAIEKPEGDKT